MSPIESRRATEVRKKDLKDRVILNVGGKRFEPYISTLRNIPYLPLAQIIESKSKLDYDEESGEYFFDRHPDVFAQVLNYYQTGKLHVPRNLCGPLFEQELAFWGIDEQQMESCCWSNYTKHRDAEENLKMLDFRPVYDDKEWGEKKAYYNDPNLSWWTRYQPIIWEILDEPYSSSTAKVFAWVSLAFIVTSIFTICLWTVQLFTGQKYVTSLHNVTFNHSRWNTTSKRELVEGDLTPVRVLTIVDAVCTGWFTLEFLLRLIFCPDKLRFLRNMHNWLDFLVIIPLYLMVLSHERTLLIEIFNTLRVVRIFRFFKLLYDLQILAKTMKASRSHLMLLLFVLFIPVIVFSSLVFYAEKTEINKLSFLKNSSDVNKNETFVDVPNSMWWGIVTMTTLGYGDFLLTSVVGKIIGAMAAICGVMVVAMSASVIGSTFSLYYNLAQAQLKLPKNHRKFDVECQTLPAILNCRTSQTESTTGSNNSDSGFQRSPNRMVVTSRSSFTFNPNEAGKSTCVCQVIQPTTHAQTLSQAATQPQDVSTQHSYPVSPRGSVRLSRKASIRRDSILV